MAEARLQTLIRLIYPPRCLLCGGLVDSDFGLCGSCWRDTPFIMGLACDLCGAPLPGQSDRAEHCDDCLATPRPWTQGRAALLYRDNGRKLVLMLKHGDRHDIARPAALWLAQKLRPLCRADAVVVPIPLHLRRHLKRRYNQSALLADGLARALRLSHLPDALIRPRATPSLEGKSREERFTTLDAALTLRPARAAALAGRQVVLVDDVMTSGATLAAATAALTKAGVAEVCVAILARVANEA